MRHGERRFETLLRYFSVSLSVYVFILAGMYLLADRLRIDKITSYVLVYVAAYFGEYVLTLTLVFRRDHAWSKVVKFILNTAFFLASGTMLFKLLLNFRVNYLIATLGVAVILLPFRFMANKHFVYR